MEITKLLYPGTLHALLIGGLLAVAYIYSDIVQEEVKPPFFHFVVALVVSGLLIEVLRSLAALGGLLSLLVEK